MLSALISFLEQSPHIRTCVRKLTLRRRSPITGALFAQTQSQILSLLSPSCLPSLRHVALINILFIRPYPDAQFECTIPEAWLVPPLESLQIHLDRDRQIWDVDVLYLLSIFRSVGHLTLTGSPVVTESFVPPKGEVEELPYRFVQPDALTLPRLSSYAPLLRMFSGTVMKNLNAFTAGLFDMHSLDETERASLRTILKDVGRSCGRVNLYYTLLDRNDRCE